MYSLGCKDRYLSIVKSYIHVPVCVRKIFFCFKVNSIAGACHKIGSKHYDGKAVDFQLFGNSIEKAAQEKAFMDECTKHGGWSHGGDHVHCQIGTLICCPNITY